MTQLTTRRQLQTLADFMADKPTELTYEQLSPFFQQVYNHIENLDRQELYQELARQESYGDNANLVQALKSILQMTPGHRPNYERLDRIEPLPPVEFLWEAWLPRGHVSALVGWPGIGKTTVAGYLAYLLESGAPAPDGQPFARRTGNTIFVDAENLLPAVYERARAWGMAGNSFYIIRDPEQMIDLTARKYQDLVWDMAYDIKPDLILIDSFSMINIGDDQHVRDVREVMRYLDETAKVWDCALLVVFHPRKPNDITAPLNMFDLRGSSHILFVVRSILGLEYLPTPDGDPNGPRHLKIMKGNFRKTPPPLRVEMVSVGPGVARPVFKAGQYADGRPTQAQECAEWLLNTLIEAGPLSYTELADLAGQAGFKQNTLQNARKLAGDRIVDTVGAGKKGNKWQVDDGETVST